MAEARVERKLTAILAADVVGYSRLTEADEEGTLARLKLIRQELIEPKIAAHRGRTVKLMGDGALVEFASAVDAVRCAVDIQLRMGERNAALPLDNRIEFRVGINVGDIVIDGDDILGDGVNVAARLEGLAEAGGICVSEAVERSVAGKVDVRFEDMGAQSLKNIAKPVPVFRIAIDRPADNAAGTHALAPPDRPSIAVLPFANLSGDPDQEYFADGMAEDIITALSRFRAFFVIARNSSFTYKGRHVDVRQVGRELGVRYVLEGSVRKGGNSLRITAQLIEAATGNHLWAEKYDGALAEVFDLQDRITEGVVGAIEPSVQKAEIERARRKRPENLDAYDLYLRALPHAWANTPSEAAKALDYLDAALGLDPSYPAAHGLAAWCHLIHFRQTVDAVEKAAAVRHARTVLATATDDAIALAFAGFIVSTFEGDKDTALDAVAKALALNPNSATVFALSARVNAAAGLAEAALDNVQRAARLSPFDPMRYMAELAVVHVYFAGGRYAEAIDAAQRTIRMNPRFGPAHVFLIASLMRLGRVSEAQAAVPQLLAAEPNARASAWLALGIGTPQFRETLAAALRQAGVPE